MPTLFCLLLLITLPSFADPIIIGHANLTTLDSTTIQRIYTGKVVEVNGIRVTPVNLPANNPLREQFLQCYLNQNNEKYIGYWTVRRYIGKGTPPRELESVAAMIQFIANTQGAIGYVDTTHLPNNIKILLDTAR
ncbi:hypothetical protein HUU62_05305 [Rhodoferax sp. 4810]|uniref:Phosphate ABC transporter substrate-binding protein n=1 Tax=Thiospirillum jenense TaxID=1653858 RepID=A0A839HD91_9GAMM|nr:hypothetical protein [Thiospirillum jenense]MBB1073827.1 hypothetical protein [Rhodoferax jenense]MBB1125218.1 hypothetical protein [Thiospirillum jenense]